MMQVAAAVGVNHSCGSPTAHLMDQNCKTRAPPQLLTATEILWARMFYSALISVCSPAAVPTSLITRQKIFQSLKQQLQ